MGEGKTENWQPRAWVAPVQTPSGERPCRHPAAGHQNRAQRHLRRMKKGAKPLLLHEPPLGHGKDVVACHDQMIQHPYVYQLQCGLEGLGQDLVGA